MSFVICRLIASPQPITTLSGLTSNVPTSVDLSWVCWDTLPAGSTFWIQHSTWSGVEWSTNSCQIEIATGPVTYGETHYHTAKGLEAGDTYYFRIWVSTPPAEYVADLAEGTTEWAQLIDETPWAISSLTVLDNPNDGGQQIKLSWTEPYNIEGDTQTYLIYRATSPPEDSNGFTLLSSSDCNEGSYAYMDSGLEDGNTYYYIVKSSDNLQESGALQFDGMNDYIDCGLDSSLDFTGRDTFTLEAWVKTTKDVNNRDIVHFGNLEVILSKTDINQWQIYARDDLSPRTVNSDNEITENEWTHVVGVCDALTLKLYVDGVEQSGTAGMTSPVLESGGVQSNSIGAKAGNFCFNGTIDDVRIYNRALSAEEVYSNYTDTDSVTTDGLISWWKFDNDTADYLQTNNGSVGGGKPYYTVGRKGNVASCYSRDETPPGGISNLTAIASRTNRGEVKLEWTSPGDDEYDTDLTTGTFVIKYSTVGIINSSDFDNPAWDMFVTTVTISTDTAVLSYQTTTFADLILNVTYYFAIKTADEVPNWSVWNSSADADVLMVNTSAWCFVSEIMPVAPSDLKISELLGTTSIYWQFKDNSDNETGLYVSSGMDV
ncbi:MAG: LamG domain-containing protein, partial [Elusimicrobia bacterium]|nr:LamG domain-containing protein [Elusimicrobiota bacterium]